MTTEAGLPRALSIQAGAGGYVDASGAQGASGEESPESAVPGWCSADSQSEPGSPAGALSTERLFDLPVGSVYDLDAAA
jgi:hypothetical protein